jgi:hypothetical protein
VKQGDLSPFVGTLRHAVRELHDRWSDTREVWNDSVSDRFGEQHVAPLDGPVTTAVKAIDRLGQVMVKAYEACSPERE